MSLGAAADAGMGSAETCTDRGSTADDAAPCITAQEWEPMMAGCLPLSGVPSLGRTTRTMKSAYELAMERLQRQAPGKVLTQAQKAELADLESLYKSKVAQLEIQMGDDIQAAQAQEDFAKVDELRERLAQQRARIEAEKEEKRRRIRGE